MQRTGVHGVSDRDSASVAHLQVRNRHDVRGGMMSRLRSRSRSGLYIIRVRVTVRVTHTSDQGQNDVRAGAVAYI